MGISNCGLFIPFIIVIKICVCVATFTCLCICIRYIFRLKTQAFVVILEKGIFEGNYFNYNRKNIHVGQRQDDLCKQLQLTQHDVEMFICIIEVLQFAFPLTTFFEMRKFLWTEDADFRRKVKLIEFSVHRQHLCSFRSHLRQKLSS